MKSDRWMIYGASGYTGQLAAESAAAQGLKPVLAGRNSEKIRAIADRLGLEHRVFDLHDDGIEQHLQDVAVVLHCAGPFSATSRPMVNACQGSKTHYLDITGEIDVFEAIHARTAEAQQSDVALIPGVGFDVVPTDCLAALLHSDLPDATHLELAFCGEGGASPGTAKTMVEMLGNGGRERVQGHIVKTGQASDQKSIPFSVGNRWCMTIPWGDVSTAYYSTGIPNIKVYTATPRSAARAFKWMSPLMRVAKLPSVQHFLKQQIEAKVQGPNEAVRASGSMNLWGQVTNVSGETKSAWLDVREGYGFTVMASLEMLRRILRDGIEPGAHTPSSAFGKEFVLSLDGSVFQSRE